jgi:hypothetical protein
VLSNGDVGIVLDHWYNVALNKLHNGGTGVVAHREET